MAVSPRRNPPPTGTHMSVEEYFQLDYLFPNEKYEYDDGVIRLMAGGTIAHDEIAFNTRAALKQQFRGGPCSVHGSDVRVQVKKNGKYYYPDVKVTCNVDDRRRDNNLIRSPLIVVEVLSPSNENEDRTKKLKGYQACPTICEIVLISQYARHVEVYHRDEEDDKQWHYFSYEPEQEIIIPTLDLSLTFDEIYADINFDEILVE